MKAKTLLLLVFALLLCVMLAACVGVPTPPTTITTHQHSFGEWSTVKDATCSAEGLQERSCECGEKESQSIDKIAHTEVVDAAVPPTCTETGLTEGKHCSVCKEILVKQDEIAANGHTFGEWTETLAPTCTAKGSEHRVCEVCDHYETREVNANGHSFGEWKQAKAPSCTSKGSELRVCAVCSHEETREVNATGHTNAAAVVENRTEATCTTDGSYDSVLYCSVCHAEVSREAHTIDKLGHDYATAWTVDAEPDCTEPGSKSHHCSRCSDKADVTEIPASGHSFSTWQQIMPTCTKNGSLYRTCTVCGHEETGEIIALGHDYSTAWTVDVEPTCTESGSKSHHCSRCTDKTDVTEIPANGHPWGDWVEEFAPTCTEKGGERRVCDACDHYETRDINALGHDHSTRWTVDVEPTCTEPGSKSHHCSRCSDKADVTEILANGHSFSTWQQIMPTCTKNGSLYRACTVCGHEETGEIIALGHDYSTAWTVDVVPTCTEPGNKSHHCLRCSDKIDVTEIPARGHSYGVWTQTKAPTCTKKGEERRDCNVCDHYETREVSVTGHTHAAAVMENQLDATCTTDGNYDSVVYCSVCQAEVSREAKTLPKLGHDHSTAWTIDVEPTCTEPGSKSHHCSRCSDKAAVTDIPATGHTLGAWVQSKAPTCTAKGIERRECDVCDYYETKNVDANGHSYYAVVTPPTVAEQGYTTHICSGCSNSYVDTYVPAIGSVGLDYEPNGYGNTCTITGIGTCSDIVLYIPTEIDGYLVTGIGSMAFSYCSSLTSITIPTSVTSIGDFAFLSCDSLTSIIVQEGNPKYHSVGNCLIETKTKTLIAGCQSSVIPDDGSVTSIGVEAFYECWNLTSITIPGSVKSIGYRAFAYCGSLTSIAIPDSVTSIGEDAFAWCCDLTSIIVQEGNPKYHAVGNCLIETETKTLIVGCQSSIIPDDGSVTSIGGWAFCGCDRMTSITIPNSVTSIGDYAFLDCQALPSITIPDSVTHIGQGAFYNCRLTSITIGNSVTEIGNSAFEWCESLTSITIPDSVTYIGNSAFSGCSSLTSIVIPDSVTSIGRGAFSDCTSLAAIIIETGTSVLEINPDAFIGCDGTIYYTGSKDVWNATINCENTSITEKVCYYSETPISGGNYWRYVDGVPTPW